MEKLILSEEDKGILSERRVRWDGSNGYYRVYEKGCKTYTYLHRLILNAKKGEIVDHIDRNRHNNTRENLRIASASLNCYNRNVENKFGRGIYLDKWGNRFRACISLKNKTLKLGSFLSLMDAKKAYNKKSLELYGENAFQHPL